MGEILFRGKYCTCFFWPKSVGNEAQILQLAWDIQGKCKDLMDHSPCGTVYKGIEWKYFLKFHKLKLRRKNWVNESKETSQWTYSHLYYYSFGAISLGISVSLFFVHKLFILRINWFTSLPLFLLAKLVRMSSFASLNPRRDIELSLFSKTLVRLFYFVLFFSWR